MHLEDAFIQSDLLFRLYIFLSVCVFPGNWTHSLCAANALFYHWATGTCFIDGEMIQIQTQSVFMLVVFDCCVLKYFETQSYM